MVSRIPRAVEPHFDSIVSQSNDHPWLVEFYLVEIRQRISDTIESDIFAKEDFKTLYPNARNLDKLFFLKNYFNPRHTSSVAYMPLRAALKDLGQIFKTLQDSWFKAMATRDEPLILQEGLPSYTHEVLREVLTREILLYIRREAKRINFKANSPSNKKLGELKHWLEKELQNLGPINQPMKHDTKRFSKIHDPSHYEIDVATLVGNLWYFINGIDRLPVFLQCELISLKKAFSSLKDITYALSKGDKKFKYNLLVGLPLATCTFLVYIIFVMFAPYRFARTMVNELTGLFRYGMNLLLRKLSASPIDEASTLKAVCFCFEWLCYGSLLWIFGLPIIPNPLTWMPSIPLSLMFIGATGFLFTVVTGAVTLALTHYLANNPILLFQRGVEKVEEKVEQGLQAVDDVHQKIFHGVVTLSPAYDRYIRLKPPAIEVEKVNNAFEQNAQDKLKPRP